MTIGILTGRENFILERLSEIMSQKNKELRVELVQLEGSKFDQNIPYTVIIDRVSHLVPYYDSYLKFAKKSGIPIINNPSTKNVLDLYILSFISNKLGVCCPKTVSITGDFRVPNPSSRNLVYPLPWMEHVNHLGGFPIIIHIPSITGLTYKKVITTFEDLLSLQKGVYAPIMLQELKEYTSYMRCICVGKNETVLLQYNASTNKYLKVQGNPWWQPNIIEASTKLSYLFDYDFCSIDWGIFEDKLYLLDSVDTLPNMSASAVDSDTREWCINQLADTCIKIAHRNENQKG